MAYFAAVLARRSEEWNARDFDLDTVADSGGLAEILRESSYDDDEPVLLVLEQEDMWFAIMRVDADEDPRVFVSDGSAASRSMYSDLLLASPAAEFDDLAVFTDGYDDPDEAPQGNGPLGDPELLTDLGVPASTLLEMCAGSGMLPSDALAEIAERGGFADALESLR